MDGADCLERIPEQAQIIVFIKVKFKEKEIASLDKNNPKSSKISQVTIGDGKILLHGFNDNRVWSMIMDQGDGKISASVSGRSHGFILFGECTPMP